MHPFLDGNGRTARAVEALMLQRAGLRDTLFIALSNYYYYDEKASYLRALSQLRADGHDLTAFLIFGLRGITKQCRHLLAEIKFDIAKALSRDVMHDLFGCLKSTRKRVIAKRHITILNCLLDSGDKDIIALYRELAHSYRALQNPWKALVRDIVYLLQLNAIDISERGKDKHVVVVRMDWPMEITESAFFEKINELPRAKTYRFLQRAGETKSDKEVEPSLFGLF